MSEVKRLLPLAGATTLNIIGLGVIIPVLPFLAKGVGATDAIAALVFSAFSAASFLASPWWGRLSDRIGRKPVMIISVGFTIASYIWLGVATELWEVFASRILAGLTAGWLATSQAFVSDVTSEENRAKGMGLLGASFGIGFTIGPGLGALLMTFFDEGYLFAALASAFFSMAGLLLTWFVIQEPERLRSEKAEKSSLLTLLKNKDIGRVCGLYFLISLMFTALEGTFALWGLARFNLGAADIGLFLAFGGIVNSIIQGGVIGRLSKRVGEARVASYGSICLFLAMVSMLMITSKWQILIPMTLLSIAMGLVTPSLQSLLTRVAAPGMKGAATGAGQSMASLARIFGPAWGGFAFEYGADLPYLFAALALIPISLWALVLVKRYPKAAENSR